jgi:putative DNA primase/helicase
MTADERPVSTWDVAAADLEPEHLTDAGNARLLVKLFGAQLRYVASWDQWLINKGTHWVADDTNEVERYAKLIAGSLYSAAGYEEDSDRRRALSRWAMQSESARAIRDMVKLARSERGVAARAEDFDRDPWLLNVQNGTLELDIRRTPDRRPRLRAHRPEDLITKLVSVAYDPAATAPAWEAFLDRIFPDRPALRTYVQRAVGYSLTGLTIEQIILLCVGRGANGKTTLLEAVAGMLADYASTVAAETLLSKKGDVTLVMNDLASLQGRRFVTAVESDMGRRMAEGLIKNVTGGEAIRVKRLYADVYSITPTFKLWVGTNHKPIVRGTDHAIWRRLRLVPFEVTIPDAEQDHQLLEKLQAERAGILSWAVEGCVAWQRDGLGTPEEVQRATAAYRGEMDVLGDFLAERCVADARASMAAAELFDAYADWALKARENVLSKRTFGQQLAERGFKPTRSRTERAWLGLRLRTAMDGDASEGVTQGEAVSDNSHTRARNRSYQNQGHEASRGPDASPDEDTRSDIFDPPEAV